MNIRFDLHISHTFATVFCLHIMFLLETPFVDMNIWMCLHRFDLQAVSESYVVSFSRKERT